MMVVFGIFVAFGFFVNFTLYAVVRSPLSPIITNRSMLVVRMPLCHCIPIHLLPSLSSALVPHGKHFLACSSIELGRRTKTERNQNAQAEHTAATRVQYASAEIRLNNDKPMRAHRKKDENYYAHMSTFGSCVRTIYGKMFLRGIRSRTRFHASFFLFMGCVFVLFAESAEVRQGAKAANSATVDQCSSCNSVRLYDVGRVF